jgi:conjugal transfer pilus assembly protein TraW
MIFPTILAIAAADLRVANSRVADLQAKDSQAEDSPVKTSQGADSQVEASQGKGSQAEDPRVEDLGVYGETFPIEEKSLLEVIRAKLQALSVSGKLEEHQKIILRKAKEQLNRPPPVKNIHRTTTPRSFDWDPSITVPYDLKDHKGQVFHRKGTKVNPLDTHPFRCPFLFVDGDDPKQVAWAINQHQIAKALHKPKIILVQGAPFDLSKKLNLPIYFDQSGVLVKKFGIAQVPARVSQKDRALIVDEINLTGENKNEN